MKVPITLSLIEPKEVFRSIPAISGESIPPCEWRLVPLPLLGREEEERKPDGRGRWPLPSSFICDRNWDCASKDLRWMKSVPYDSVM